MIRELATAIRQKFVSSTQLYSLLSGGLWFQRAPQNATYPYATLYIIAADKEEYMGGPDDCMRRVQLQISIFSDVTDGGEQIALLAEKFNEAFDWCELWIHGYASVKLENTVTGPITNIDDIWQAVLNYEVWYSKE